MFCNHLLVICITSNRFIILKIMFSQKRFDIFEFNITRRSKFKSIIQYSFDMISSNTTTTD